MSNFVKNDLLILRCKIIYLLFLRYIKSFKSIKLYISIRYTFVTAVTSCDNYNNKIYKKNEILILIVFNTQNIIFENWKFKNVENY